MSSKEQKTPDEKNQQDDAATQTETTDNAEAKAQTEQTQLHDEKIASLQLQLAEAQTREQESLLRAKAEIENMRRRTEQDIEKAHKFALEKFVTELLPVLDSLDRALEVADKDNAELLPMLEGIELTQKSMLDVVGKFGVLPINQINVPLDPNVHQAIAVLEAEEVAENHIIGIMQKGYTLNGRTIRAAMVTVAKAKT